MGWLFTYGERKSLIQELTKSEERVSDETGVRTVHNIIAHCMRGNNLWAVMEVAAYGGDGKQTYHNKFIMLYLLANGGQDGWGYKDVDESMGPYYSNCPLSYLELVKDFPPQGYAADWRERVREFHKNQAIKRAAKRGDKMETTTENQCDCGGIMHHSSRMENPGGSEFLQCEDCGETREETTTENNLKRLAKPPTLPPPVMHTPKIRHTIMKDSK